jgi:hypothetical protein
VNTYLTRSGWNSQRPRILVVACSDGRLQENLDDFLISGLGIAHYDRLYAPGGGGALASSGMELLRCDRYRQECRFLVDAHGIEQLYFIFHGPSGDGPEEALCADYRRKFPWAPVEELMRWQVDDANELRRTDWGKSVQVHTYRCEIRGDNKVQFVEF